MAKKITARQIDKAYSAYRKRLKGLKKNKKNPNVMTKGQFIKKNYPDYGKTIRTLDVEHGLSKGGLSYKQIQRLKGR